MFLEKRIQTRSRRYLAVGVAISLILSACASSSPSSQPSTAPTTAAAATSPATVAPLPTTLTKVNVLMGYLWAQSQYYCQYLLGVEKGFYAAEGLDVTFAEGQGSGSGSQLIANGQYDFGASISAGAAIRAITKGAPVEIVAATLPFNPIGVISKSTSGIKSPQDLIGKKIGMPPGTEQAGLWPAFDSVNNLKAGQYQLVNISADALPAALGTGQIDGYVSYSTDIPSLKAAGIDAQVMLIGDFGVHYAPGEGIVASQRIIDQNPDLVARFVRAIEKTITYAIDHPDEAAAAGVKMEPSGFQQDVAVATLGVINAEIAGPLKAGTLFKMSDTEIQDTLTLLTTYAGLQGALSPSKYYTNQFQ